MKQFSKITVFILLIIGGWWLVAGTVVRSQDNIAFIFNWKSEAFVPAFYQGKSLPTNKTAIEAGFEIIENNQLVNLSGQKISWLVGGDLIDSRVGLQKISFFTDAFDRSDIVVQVHLQEFRGGLTQTFVIPLTDPELVVEGRNNNLYSWPFFFNVGSLADINFGWEANGQQTAGEVNAPNVLELEFPEDGVGNINITATAQNKLNLLEVAKKVINLFY